jgi:hypothetical protein
MFDAYFAGISADDPQAREYAQEIRDAMTVFRGHLVTFTETAAQGAERALQMGEDGTWDSAVARIAPVAARVKEAIGDTAGPATLRLRRMIGQLDEKYGTARDV